MRKYPFASLLLLVQGAFFLGTGVWPLISRRTFEKVTGPKTDFWLVKTVGVLVAVIGAVFLGLWTFVLLRKKG